MKTLKTSWKKWGKNTAPIIELLTTKLDQILENNTNNCQEYFNEFLININDLAFFKEVSSQEAKDFLIQYYVTKPILNILFDDMFLSLESKLNQIIYKATNNILGNLSEIDLALLQPFYDNVKKRVSLLENFEDRETLIAELYESFYKNAFPKLAQRLGIIFTPVEVVDFMLRMVNDTLKNTFNESLASENTTILDPFTGTGTFITRLLQSNMLTTEQAINLYNNRLFANEIVLLSYYIASVNIESALYNRINLDKSNNRPFPGILLTDTFAMYEAKQDDTVEKLLQKNHARRDKQQQANINVIIGNPPYSRGQKNENDDNQNVKYQSLDKRIADTYVKDSNAASKNSLYDSFIKALRWATDRLGNKGIISFISGSSILEKSSTDGLRKHLAQDFTNLYFIKVTIP